MVGSGSPVSSFQTISGPFPQVVPSLGGGIYISLPVTAAPPYTAVGDVFPNGANGPTGTGVRVSVACDASGVATMSFISGVAAPAPLSVPVLPAPLLALLGLLLAVAGGAWLRVNRRHSPRRA